MVAVLAQSGEEFEGEFLEWLGSGAISTVLFFAVVMVVIVVVLAMSNRSSRY
jgi:hypothetical protein